MKVSVDEIKPNHLALLHFLDTKNSQMMIRNQNTA